jgi:hypothetical protein
LSALAAQERQVQKEQKGHAGVEAKPEGVGRLHAPTITPATMAAISVCSEGVGKDFALPPVARVLRNW